MKPRKAPKFALIALVLGQKIWRLPRIQNLSLAVRNLWKRPVRLPSNVLVTATHGSARFPLHLFRHLTVYYQTSPRLLLNFSDYGTKALLDTVPDEQKVIPRYGRIVGDPNRDLKQKDLIRFEDFGGNKIFRKKFEKRLTTSFLRFIWRRKFLNYSYHPYYRNVQKKLEHIAKDPANETKPIVFVDVHDVGNRLLGRRSKEDKERKRKIPKIVISNAPDEEVEEGVFGTAPDYFVEAFADLLSDNLKIDREEIKLNHIYKGGNIIRYFGNPRKNSRLRRALKGRKIFAIQVEFNRSWYLNEKNQRIYRQKMKFVRSGLMKSLKQTSELEL
ncbi:MAG: N-formylglutamate amidohydrolase [Candidatus Gracilibacteria bacterium]|nr:N-formylglutamate amidohydrolase [Candidatus Gracilibacteria bacterium]